MGNMVIFGGELANGSLASDVWMYRPLHDDWQQLGFSNSQSAPKLANHAAAVVDSYLYVFGGRLHIISSVCSLCLDGHRLSSISPYFPGRTEEDLFSSSLYRFGLNSSGGWETVQPTAGKPPATAGHSMVFYSPSRTLLVYGGHRPTTTRHTPTHAWPNWKQKYTHSQLEKHEKIWTHQHFVMQTTFFCPFLHSEL